MIEAKNLQVVPIPSEFVYIGRVVDLCGNISNFLLENVYVSEGKYFVSINLGDRLQLSPMGNDLISLMFERLLNWLA